MKGEVVLIDFFFSCGCLVVSTSFVKKLTFSPLDCLCCCLKVQAVSNIYIYFCHHYNDIYLLIGSRSNGVIYTEYIKIFCVNVGLQAYYEKLI